MRGVLRNGAHSAPYNANSVIKTARIQAFTVRTRVYHREFESANNAKNAKGFLIVAKIFASFALFADKSILV
jgi:hypothetical protein